MSEPVIHISDLTCTYGRAVILSGVSLTIGKGEICAIIGHHHSPGKINTGNFKILYDADLLVNLEEEVGTENKERIKRIIAKGFLTATGKKLAASKYLL